jgi:hypothetical protein
MREVAFLMVPVPAPLAVREDEVEAAQCQLVGVFDSFNNRLRMVMYLVLRCLQLRKRYQGRCLAFCRIEQVANVEGYSERLGCNIFYTSLHATSSGIGRGSTVTAQGFKLAFSTKEVQRDVKSC